MDRKMTDGGHGPEPQQDCLSGTVGLLDNEPQHTNYCGALLCSSTPIYPFLCLVCLGIFIVPLTEP